MSDVEKELLLLRSLREFWLGSGTHGVHETYRSYDIISINTTASSQLTRSYDIISRMKQELVLHNEATIEATTIIKHNDVLHFVLTTTAHSPRRGAAARIGMEGAKAMDVDSSASGAAAGAQNFDEIDDIDAITCLAQIWHQAPLRSVPKRVHVCVSGTTELVHANVHRDVNRHVPQSDLAQLLHDRDPKQAFY